MRRASHALPYRAIAVAAGLGADRVLGEPPLAVHPVARFGQVMDRFERRIHRDDRVTGVAFCAIGVIGAGAVGWCLQRALGRDRAVALTTFACVAGRMLGEEATAIGRLLEADDLDGARLRLPTLVGRSPDGLSAAEIARAVIESVAENSIDAMVAPVFWAWVGGAPGVCAHRAINTLDAMVGHHSERYERFGWASARLDDAVNWVPARMGAALVMAVRPARAAAVLRTVRRDAGQHPSPNGGVIESAYAAALGIRLGGANRYGDTVEHRGVLGDGRLPEPADIAAAVSLLRSTTAAVGALGIALGVLGRAGLRVRRRRG
ncbi:MAG: cobD [Acidimicrobiales bacterium]|nr:cobD [Acidimicrobiales bacterium]